MGKTVAEYQSKSKPGRKYSVKIGEDGVTYCDCWQWKINKTCKHTEDYQLSKRVDNARVETQPDVDPLQEAINNAVAFMKGNV